MRRWPLAFALVASAACRGAGQRPGGERAERPHPSPANEPPGATCEDVGRLRTCWGVGGTPHLADRPLPLPTTVARSPMGWRCAGPGSDRVCRDRRSAAPPFTCEGGRCTQLYPRMPDDGEWQCATSGGATVCKGGERAAGVADAPPDPGWRCGVRRRSSGRTGQRERICVDLSPDFPDGRMTGWRCRYEHEPPLRRLCARDPAAAVLTAPCAPERPCLDGSLCVSGVCLPPPPGPDCWLDGDCAAGRCRFGTCAKEGA